MEPAEHEDVGVLTSELGFGAGLAVQPDVATANVWESYFWSGPVFAAEGGFGVGGFWVRLALETTPNQFAFCGDHKPTNNVEFCWGRYLTVRLLPSYRAGVLAFGPVLGVSLGSVEYGAQVRADLWTLPGGLWTASWVVDGVAVSPDGSAYGLLLETQLVIARRWGPAGRALFDKRQAPGGVGAAETETGPTTSTPGGQRWE